MSDSSKRRLRCPHCGHREARVWASYLGSYLFVHCHQCKRDLRSGDIAAILVRQDRKALNNVRQQLLADWKAGKTS